MLKPLPRGRHTLSVGANYDASKQGYGAMHQSFEYVLDVGGPNLFGVEGTSHRDPGVLLTSR